MRASRIALKTIPSLLLGVGLLSAGSVWATTATEVSGTVSISSGSIDSLSDKTSEKASRALINYEAVSRMQDYMLNQELLFMAAPATIWAMQAGEVIGASKPEETAMSISEKSLINSLGGLTKSTKVTIRGVEYSTEGLTTSPVAYYDKLKTFFEAGDTSNLASLNFASVIQTTNIAKEGSPVTKDQAQALVNILSDPYPYLDPAVVTKLKSGQPLSGQDMETIGTRVAAYAVVGVSAMALGDIVARRIPTQGQQKSVMDIMRTAEDRVKDKDWYDQLGAASEAALLREIAQMMAFNQWIAYRQSLVMDQQTALLSSMNAVMAKVNTGLDQMTRQLIATQAQAQAGKAELQQQMNDL